MKYLREYAWVGFKDDGATGTLEPQPMLLMLQCSVCGLQLFSGSTVVTVV